VAVGLAWYLTIRWAEAPLSSDAEHPPSKIVVIPEGAAFQQVAALLEEEQLIKSRSAFLWLGKSQEAERKIHPGEYELHAAMPPAEILSKLVAGRVVLHAVTIPEGYTIGQIAEAFADQRITDKVEFVRLAREFRPEVWKAICTRTPIAFHVPLPQRPLSRRWLINSDTC
jgi:UPF0755 protein